VPLGPPTRAPPGDKVQKHHRRRRTLATTTRRNGHADQRCAQNVSPERARYPKLTEPTDNGHISVLQPPEEKKLIWIPHPKMNPTLHLLLIRVRLRYSCNFRSIGLPGMGVGFVLGRMAKLLTQQSLFKLQKFPFFLSLSSLLFLIFKRPFTGAPSGRGSRQDC
jgi:hypothetical protein